MVRLRLKVVLESDKLTLPLNYKHLLQGVIYSTVRNHASGPFFHDTGFRSAKRTFKLFVLSDLAGNFSIQNRKITFTGNVEFSISSLSNAFLEHLYKVWQAQGFLRLGNTSCKIQAMAIETLPWFPDVKEVHVKTLSPVTAYRSDQGRYTYYSPKDPAFAQLCLQNLQQKNEAYFHYAGDLQFAIRSVGNVKKRIVYFKNTFYVAYSADMTLVVNFETLQLIWDSGLSAKNPAGFGMIQVLS